MMVTEQRPIPVGWPGVTAGYPSRAILNRAQCVTVAPGIAVCVVLRSTAALDEPTIIAPAACHDHFSNAETRGPSIQDHHGARQFVGSCKNGRSRGRLRVCKSDIGAAPPAERRERTRQEMIVLGVILILVGYLLPVPAIIATIGWILLVIGVVLLILGQVGRPVGGRRYWY
jgi:hypothetical protein